ncbi:hypothetical protein [Acetobacterium tundrae]|uniref:Uncharacterized protein n=1 Tax=Acetobacterium tundrae TaxID=132932 RepID=A0ABR6WI06_9FIRM|nr:hypothetical protein [Acetobacterium tundrae]MBC3796130.1 hypothetical protein [Acetobacterium tundrae]
MRSEFIEKMIQAKKIEKEAFSSLLPKSMVGHMDVIEKEMKMMIRELAMECVIDAAHPGSEPKEEKKVKKVTIS